MKRYTLIVKAEHTPAKFVKYRASDLLKFCAFLDKRWPSWTWANVYDKETREQVGSFTKYRRPTEPNPY